jgi:hypothetical protein
MWLTNGKSPVIVWIVTTERVAEVCSGSINWVRRNIARTRATSSSTLNGFGQMIIGAIKKRLPQF